MQLPKNRWLMALAAVGTHLSIGSIYAYSAWSMPLENTFGWSSTNTALAFSIAIATLGLSAAFLGPFVAKRSARFGCLLATLFFCIGLLGSALACKLENLPLFYLFFGGISGVGLGLGYVAPVSTLVKWFPKQRGLATGLAIMGFGFGGMVCTQLIDTFSPATAEVAIRQSMSAREYSQWRAQEPTSTAVATIGDGGTRTVLLYDKDAIVRTFLILAAIYFCILFPSALIIAPPQEESQNPIPEARTLPARQKHANVVLTPMQALRSPVFYGLWLLLFLNATCGIALIATAKKMGYEMVHLSAAGASALVMGISIFNGIGRIFWSTLSDRLGRPNMFIAFFALQVLAFPALAHTASIPWLFMALTFVILSCYGGGFATMPAYISDFFGIQNMAVIFGWILTAWSLAGIVGPMLNAAIYDATHSYQLSLYLFTGMLAIGLVIACWTSQQYRSKPKAS
jgi:MFS transporter, OFA family, oxalate/formate antiporter